MKAARLLLIGMACLCLSTSLSVSAASKGDVQITYAYKGDLYSAIVKVNYQGGQKLRRETRLVSMNQPIGTMIISSPVILRRDLGVRWVVNDEHRSFVELDLRPEDTGLFLPNLKEFRKEKKAEVNGYACQVYRNKKEADYVIWVLWHSNMILRVERGSEDNRTIYEATEVSFGAQNDSLFEPPSDYRKLTLAQLMKLDVTPPMIADSLLAEAESVCITDEDGDTSRELGPIQVEELRHYVSSSGILAEEFCTVTQISCWFTIRLKTGRELALVFDYPAGLFSVGKSDVNRECWYAYGLHPDLSLRFYLADYRLSAPEGMREWVDRLLPERKNF